MTTQTHTYRVHIGAGPGAVYAALTDPAALQAWLAEHAEVSLPSGGEGGDGVFEFWGRYTPEGERGRQRLLAAEPGRRLAFAWTLQGAETEVDITLEPEDGGTLATLTHSGVPPRPSGDSYWVGDLLMLSLANLASYCERRSVGPRCDFTALGGTEARSRSSSSSRTGCSRIPGGTRGTTARAPRPRRSAGSWRDRRGGPT